MIYPKKVTAQKGELIIKIAIVISILIGLLLVLINKLTTPDTHWAGFCNAGIIYIWITVYYSINKNINIAAHVLIQTIAISLLTVYIDYKIGFSAWSISIAIPIMIIIANITMLILSIVSYRRFIRYAIYQLIIVLFSMMPIIFIYEELLTNNVLSIVASSISVLNLVICLILCAKEIYDEIIRKFHV